jgi:hypothetical protein
MLESIHRALYNIYFERDLVRGERKLTRLRSLLFEHYTDLVSRRPEGRLAPVPVVSGIGAEEIVRDWVKKQRPVLLKDAAAHWPAISKWGFDFFEKNYGDEMIAIGKERIERADDGTSFDIDVEGLSIRDFVRRVGAGEDVYLKFNPILERFPSLYEDLDYEQLGQWSGGQIRPEASDNEFYMGGANTRTHLHTELSDIFHVCIKGRKRWVMYPPKEWSLLYPIPARTSFVASEVNVLDPDFETHPLARYARGWEAVIEPGDILYLPAYTWHAVENPEPAISVNLLWHDNVRSMRALPLAFFNWRFMQDDSKGTADQFLEYFRGAKLPSLHG